MSNDTEGAPAEHVRFTIRCEPGVVVDAAHAARYEANRMPSGPETVRWWVNGAKFYVKRTRGGGISVTQERMGDGSV